MKINYPMVSAIVFALLLLATVKVGFSADSITTPWQPTDLRSVSTAKLAGLTATTQADLRSGNISTQDDLLKILRQLQGGSLESEATYVLHVLKLPFPSDTNTKVDKWYQFDPQNPLPKTMLIYSESEWISRAALRGQKKIILVSLQITVGGTAAEINVLKAGVVSYNITAKKMPVQLARDLSLLAALIAPEYAGMLVKLDSAPDDAVTASQVIPVMPDGGHASVVTITASVTMPLSAGAVGKPAAVSSEATYLNEPPALVGFSMAFPLTSYKDVTVDKVSGTISPKSMKRQDSYACIDLFLPALEPVLRNRSYRPHPFIGLPITGKPLQHPMGGVALGYRGVELYFAGVCDLENRDAISGAKKTSWKSSFGVKISLEAAAKALGNVTSK